MTLASLADIRTYGVVTLNEECGFIQWVPNTIPIRPVLIKRYDARRVRSWVRLGPSSLVYAAADMCAQSSEMTDVFKKIKDAPDKEAATLFTTKILPLCVQNVVGCIVFVLILPMAQVPASVP